jgi:hypothetical protein
MENYDSLRILFIRHAETNYAIFGGVEVGLATPDH